MEIIPIPQDSISNTRSTFNIVFDFTKSIQAPEVELGFVIESPETIEKLEGIEIEEHFGQLQDFSGAYKIFNGSNYSLPFESGKLGEIKIAGNKCSFLFRRKEPWKRIGFKFNFKIDYKSAAYFKNLLKGPENTFTFQVVIQPRPYFKGQCLYELILPENSVLLHHQSKNKLSFLSNRISGFISFEEGRIDDSPQFVFKTEMPMVEKINDLIVNNVARFIIGALLPAVYFMLRAIF